MIELDHICLGVRNIYEGAQRLREETGLDNYEGGLIPPGTANRIVPLPNDVFIEIESWIIPVDGNPFGQWYIDATAAGDAWMFWCLRASTMEEMEAIAERLGSRVFAAKVGRIKPDGEEVGYSMAPASGKPWAAGLPNWYFREDPSRHPARTAVDHRRDFTGVSWMEVGGDPAVMEEHVTPEVFERLPLRFVDETPGLYAVAIGTEDGDEVVIRASNATPLIPPIAATIEITQEMLDRMNAGQT